MSLVSDTDLEARLARALRELGEAREQQAATAEVLKAISRSTFDLQNVLETMVESAARICRADKGNIARVGGGGFRFVAFSGFEPDYRDYMKALPLSSVDRGSITGRTVLEGRTVHIPDVLADPDFTWFEAQKRGGFRTGLGVPLLREGTPIGVFFLTRTTVDPFTQQQIELVTTFADQAVIAIENARLFDEVQARTCELSESLEQQTATADMLNVISRSAFDLQSVLETLVGSAARICRADRGNIARVNGDRLQFVAFSGFQPDYREYMQALSLQIDRGSISGRAVLEGRMVHIADVLTDAEFTMFAAQKFGGFRTGLGVPLLREGIPIGVFFLTRAAVDPFAPRQIELLTTFADQAVIAIENARLFEEVQARTRELSEALEQQTATSEVLGVISSSPGELDPVFRTLLNNALRICEAEFGNLFLYEDGAFRDVSKVNAPPGFEGFLERGPISPSPGTALARIVSTRQTVHIEDIRALEAFSNRNPFVVAGVEAGIRTLLVVPMLKDGELIGVIGIYRLEVRPFNDNQIELVNEFCQASRHRH